jgi:hypothetical protein
VRGQPGVSAWKFSYLLEKADFVEPPRKHREPACLVFSGPWHFLKKTNLNLETGINAMTALRDIKSKGYHLITSENLSGSLENA